MIHGIKTDKLDALVANVRMGFYSGGRHAFGQLELLSSGALLRC